MRFSTLLLSILVLFLTNACSNKKYLSNVSAQNTLIHDSLSNDIKSDSIIAPYKVKINRIVSEKLIMADFDLILNKTGGSLGNLFADILQEEAKKNTSKNIDFVFLNSNSIHTKEIKKGVVTAGQIYDAIPVNYSLVLCQIKGSEIKKLFDKIVDTKDGIISKTASIFYTQVTQYSSYAINSIPIVDDEIYTLLTTDFIFYGGEGYDMNSVSSETLDLKMRDAVLNNLRTSHKNGNKIDQEIYNRIYVQ